MESSSILWLTKKYGRSFQNMGDFPNTGIDPISSTSYQTKPTHYLHGDHTVKRISWTIAAALVVGLFLPVNAAHAEPTTIFGRDSGANRCIIRQFIKLTKGDVLSVKNYSSSIGTINTSINTGGLAVGHCAFFMGFMLSPI